MGQSLRVAETKHGTFTYHSEDRFLGASLRIYGEYSEGEVDFYASALKPTYTSVEVGSNIGALTVPLSRYCRRVFAFEPQAENFALLQKNIKDNDVQNVITFALALGAEKREDFMPTVAEIDTADEWGNIGNYGIAQLGHGSCKVEVVTLDDMMKRVDVDFMKLDCEGSELDVLRGAAPLIERCNPLLYVENDRPNKSEALIAWLDGAGYKCHWHKPLLFNPNNYRRYQHNMFDQSKSTNMICIRGHEIDPIWLKDPVLL